jgi:hypothetical protein
MNESDFKKLYRNPVTNDLCVAFFSVIGLLLWESKIVLRLL